MQFVEAIGNINNNKFASPLCHLEIGDFEFRLSNIGRAAVASCEYVANLVTVGGVVHFLVWRRERALC